MTGIQLNFLLAKISGMHKLPAVALILLILPPQLAHASVMSLDMLEGRAVAALMAMYSEKYTNDVFACQSRRTDSEPTGFFVLCTSANAPHRKHYWRAGIADGHVVELVPLSEPAVADAPAAESALPPENDPGYLVVRSYPDAERTETLRAAIAQFR
jgi:hypothetical protein